MNRSLTVFGVALALVVAANVMAQGQAAPGRNDVIHVPVAALNWVDVVPGISRSVVWGDPDAGAHGAFMELVRAYDSGMHTHASSVRIVVLRGAFVYKDKDGEKRVGPGDFFRIPPRRPHSCGGDPAGGAYFYQEAAGKYDIVAVK